MIRLKELVRTNLEEELVELREKPLLLITSPSGYGKTTLLKNYLDKQRGMTVIWVSISQEMADEVWVWNKLCEKCREVNERLADQMSLIGLPGTAQEAGYICDILRNEISRPSCLVIDNFQECGSPSINQLITRIVYERIPDFHMAVVSSIYPEIPYEEMFLRGYCTVLNQTELALSRDETEEVFRINGVSLDAATLDSIYGYTDGWISAVYLTLYDYRRNQRLGSFTSASHLLRTAIFDKLLPKLQELYMKMSLFESFTLQAAVYIAEIDILPEALTDAVETYGFMEYDAALGEYRMHSLLRMAAAGELERRQVDKKALYNRGGEWYKRNGEYLRAVVSFRKAENSRAILMLLSGESRYTVMESMPGILKEFFMDLSQELKLEYPIAYLSYIYSTIMGGDMKWGEHIYEEAAGVYERLERAGKIPKRLQGEFSIITALMEFNDIEKMRDRMKLAYELLDHRPSEIFRQTLLTYGVPFMTLLYYRRVGDLKKTIELEKEYAHFHQYLVGIGDGRWDDLFDAEYAVLTGDFLKAVRLAEQVRKKALFQKQPCVVISSYYIQFKSMMCMGEWQQVAAQVKEFMKYREALVENTVIVDAELVYSYVYACMGQKENMAEWMQNFELDRCNWVVRNARSGCLVYGMFLCRTQNWSVLDSIADQILVPYDSTSHTYAQIKGYVFKAIAVFHTEDSGKAGEYLKMALSMAEPDEVRVIFIESSIELEPILAGISLKSSFLDSIRSAVKEYVRQYQKMVQELENEKQTAALTAREKELLELVEKGFRNADISKELHIAQVTVEKTLTGLYRKLGVSNRSGAVTKWREMQSRN